MIATHPKKKLHYVLRPIFNCRTQKHRHAAHVAPEVQHKISEQYYACKVLHKAWVLVLENNQVHTIWFHQTWLAGKSSN